MTIKMLNKLVAVPRDPRGVVQTGADGGHQEGEHVILGQT